MVYGHEEMASMRKFLFAFIAVIVLGLAAPAQSTTNMVACYGETIEVTLRGYEARGDDDGSVIMSLPNDHHWLVYTRLNPPELHSLPCQDEPVAIRYAKGAALTGFDGRSQIYPNYLRRLSITGSRTPNGLEGSRYDFSADIAANGIDLPSGFRGRLLENPSKSVVPRHNGFYQFPLDHLSPLGESVFWWCGSWTCHGAYGFLDKLYVNYDFSNKDIPLSSWLEQDKALQDLINSWIK